MRENICEHTYNTPTRWQQIHTCQHMVVEEGKVKSHAQVGVKGTIKYRANLAKHEALAKKLLRARMHDTMNYI